MDIQDEAWEKQFHQQLMIQGATWEQARAIIGLVAEHRQIADREGYRRGFRDGCEWQREQAYNEKRRRDASL